MSQRPIKSRVLAATLLVLSSIASLFAYGCVHTEVPQPVVVTRPEVILGPTTWSQWQAEAGWNTYSAGAYSPPEEEVRQLAKLVGAKNATFIIFGGSWCPDSRAQLPTLFRLFELASIPQDRIQLYGVGFDRREPTGTAAQYGISRVPTMVVLSDGREIGRIAEFPTPNWLDNLISILSQ